MKVLLIQPPICDFYRTRFREYPLGLLYLHSSLLRAGFKVELLDARACKRPKAAPIPAALRELPQMFAKYEGLFGKFLRFGLSPEEISRKVSEINPDAVCINFMCTAYENEAIETAQAVKAAKPDCKVFAGGWHATASPESLAVESAIDFVVRGEGEEILPKLLRKLPRQKIVDNKGRPFIIDDPDSLPLPSHGAIAGRHFIGKKRYAMMITSRGCPHSCSFCATRGIMGTKFRKRSVASVWEEANFLARDLGVRAIDLQDDAFMADLARTAEILEKMIPLRDELGLELMATNGLNPHGIDREMACLLKRAGFKKIDLALGTGNVPSRSKMNRPELFSSFVETIETCNLAGLPVTTYFIIGIPTQPLTEMYETFEFLKAQDTLISPSVFYNVQGMPIFDEMTKFEHSRENVARRASAFNCFGNDFTREDIVGLFSEIRTHNLTKK